jgi:hypothetical protein
LADSSGWLVPLMSLISFGVAIGGFSWIVWTLAKGKTKKNGRAFLADVAIF